MRRLKVNPDYKRMVPRPSFNDLQALEVDIIAKGEAIVPIIVNQDDVILDGHTRYDICTRNGCYFTTTVREFDSLLEEQMFVISVNLFRRHLSDYKKVELARPLERLVAKQAEANMISGVALPSNEDKVVTDDVVAKQIGVSRGTYERAKKIRDSQNHDIQGKVRRGELSISAGYNKLLPPKPPKPKPVKVKPESFLECLCSQCEHVTECVEASS